MLSRAAVVVVPRRGRPVAAETVRALAAGREATGRRLVARRGDDPAPVPDGWTRVEVPATVTDSTAANRVLATVREPYVALLADGAQPEPGWLRRPVELLDEDDRLSVVAPVVVGRPRLRLSFTGLPYPDGRPHRPSEEAVLSPFPEALVGRCAHLRAVGGFDDRLEGPGTEVDLGWRLWVAGGSVRACPSSSVRPPGAPFRDDRALVRNALAAMFKCYDDEHLGVALPAALLSLPDDDRFGGEIARQAIDDFTALMPSLRESRLALQGRRQRPDAQVLRLFGDPLGGLRPGSREAGVADGLGLADAFGTRRRVLIVTLDVFTHRMAGPAIRAWQIADALADEHDVVLVTLAQLCTLTSERFTVEAADAARMAELERWCEIVVVQGFVLAAAPVLRTTAKLMLVDVYDPLQFETLELAKSDPAANRGTRVQGAVDVLNEQLRRGDFFVCASEKQRDLWIGQLSALGRINPQTYDEDPTLRSLVDVVPFGLPDADPTHDRNVLRGVVPGIGADAEIILWAGGIYNWFDPLSLIEAVDELRKKRPRVRLFFMGLRHPNPDVPQMKMAVAAQALADELGLTDRFVFFNEGWVSYDDRQNYLMEADIGVSTHMEHAETAYSFRTRILDYLWGGLPVVATAGDSFAELIDGEGLGVVVPPSDVGALRDALGRLLEDKGLASACRANIDRVRPRFRWSSVLAPVVEFCHSPRRAPDRVTLDGAAAVPLRFSATGALRLAATTARRVRRVRQVGVKRTLVIAADRIDNRLRARV